MYKIELSGCLTSFIIILIIYFLVKELWWFIVGIIGLMILYQYADLIYKTIKNKQEEKKANYNPEMGEVYKICPYCNSKLRISEQTCPFCKRALN